jgi:hypothetical protein
MKPTEILNLNYNLFFKNQDLAEKQEDLVSEEIWKNLTPSW